MRSDQIEQAATFIAENRLGCRAFSALPDGLQPADLDEAYAVQWAVHDQMMAQGEDYIGWKVGVVFELLLENFHSRVDVYHSIVGAVEFFPRVAFVGIA